MKTAYIPFPETRPNELQMRMMPFRRPAGDGRPMRGTTPLIRPTDFWLNPNNHPRLLYGLKTVSFTGGLPEPHLGRRLNLVA